MNYQLFFDRKALKSIEDLHRSGLLPKVNGLLKILGNNPFQNPPPYEKLVGDLKGCYSRRINIQHRLVYTIDSLAKTVTILALWSHYA